MTQLIGKIHKRIDGAKDSYGTGDALCSLIPVRQLRHSWRNITCKICLRHKPKDAK